MKQKRILAALAVLAIGGGAGYLAWQHFFGNPLDRRYTDDFMESAPLVDAALPELSELDKLHLVGFGLRVRMCHVQEGIWIHRGVTLRQAVEAERILSVKDAPQLESRGPITCAVPGK